MSFLNPVNEPVLRFSSTDADAPQINYAARTAGDVKMVLKACLVTGYGAKTSAGWSIVNEVDHVAEFVSPSAAMSDYRLGVDDSTTTKTDWYYIFQGAREDTTGGSPTKAFTYCDKTHSSNGWQLLATDKGFIFIEMVYQTSLNKVSARLTYIGRVKSAIENTNGANMSFFNVGHDGSILRFSYMYTADRIHFRLGTYDYSHIFGSHTETLGSTSRELDTMSVEMVSPLYVCDRYKRVFLAEIPAILGVSPAKADSILGVLETTINGRPALRLSGFAGTLNNTVAFAPVFMIYLDVWDY